MTTSPLTITPPELLPELRAMLDELEWARLEVGLIPAPEQRHAGHSVRLAHSHNPAWYRELAQAFPRIRRLRSQRHPRYSDPRFTRADVAATLGRLLQGGSRSYLAMPLLSVAALRQQQAEEALAAEQASLAAAWFPWDAPAGMEVAHV